MIPDKHSVVDVLRGRVLRGIQAGSLRAGDRLPTSRDAAEEFGVDYRVVIAAYKQLASEGLVELRPRGGIYVSSRPGGRRGVPPLPEQWFVEILVQGLGREIPGPELHEWLRRSVETLRLRAAVITSTADQAFGLCRELSDGFGLEAEGVLADEVREGEPLPLAVRRADLVLTTPAHAGAIEWLTGTFHKPIIAVDVRPELLAGDWALLLRQPVYVVVGSVAFGEMVRRFYASVSGIENLRVVVYGQDDLSLIPDDAPTYVTQLVRANLAGVRIPGRILPAARVISTESARQIFAFVVRSNLDAVASSGW